MTIIVPDDSLEGLVNWMMHGPWPEHMDEAFQDHIYDYCSEYSIDGLDELSYEIGVEWVANLIGIAMLDFLSRETEDGNVVDRYLKKRAHKERSVAKAYMRGIRNSFMSLYEIADMRPDKPWMMRDLILGGEPILVVEEDSATITSVAPGDHLAIRIAKVRGHHVMAGYGLPYDPDLSERVIRAIRMCADGLAGEVGEDLDVAAQHVEASAVEDLTLALVLKLSAPVFSFSWLAGSVPAPDEITVLALRQFRRLRLRA